MKRSSKIQFLVMVLAVTSIVTVAALAGQSQRGGGGGKSRGGFGTRPPQPPPEVVQPAPTDTEAATTGTEAATTGSEGAATGTDAALAAPAAAPMAPAPAGNGGRTFGGGPAAGPAASAAAPGSYESYRILTDRNIFMKNRSRPQFGRGGAQRPAPPENPDDRIVLTGIIQQGADGIAFFEDTRSRKTIRVQAGDAIGRGRATAVALDEVQYAYDGTTTKVAVGSNLTGRATALSSPAAPPTPAAAAPPTVAMRPGGPPMGGPPVAGPSGPAAGPPAAGPPVVIVVGPDNSTGDETDSDSAEQPPAAGPSAAGNPMDNSAASILERMRQRREQELQK